MIPKLLLAIGGLCLVSCNSQVQKHTTPTEKTQTKTSVLENKIQQIIKDKKAKIGIAISSIEDHQNILSIEGDTHFPMQSVFKFHLALAILNEVDKGTFSLDQKILVKKSDLLPDTVSPMRDEYPDENVALPLSKIIGYTVSQSDNNGCDLLFRLIGGTQKVNDYIHQLGVQDVAIVGNEADMHKDANIQYKNFSSPNAAVQLLEKAYSARTLSKQTHDFLWKTMEETTTGKDKLRALLPTTTIVAHKTGSSGTNKQGLTPATNDIGIITLPNGKHFAIAVFVSDSQEDDKTNAKIIAEVAKATWDELAK